MLEVSIGAVARVKRFVGDAKSEGGSELSVRPRESWPDRGAVVFRNVSASYATTGPVLKNITMAIAPGDKVGICGRSGSGKSSLAASLFRMLDIDERAITIDGLDISQTPPELLRSKLFAVPQETCILSGTVRFNVDPNSSFGDAAIIQALEQVGLWPTLERRGGLDAEVDDAFFSQGQCRLLGCARAALRKSQILVLDETTSSLDEEASGIVADLVRTRFSGWTVIAIAHKLSTVRGFDKIAVLNNGSLVDFDSPDALLERQSLFKELFTIGAE